MYIYTRNPFRFNIAISQYKMFDKTAKMCGEENTMHITAMASRYENKTEEFHE